MTITLVKTTGSGRASQVAESGIVDLNFLFAPSADTDTAVALTCGFIDALLDSVDEDSGLIHAPEVGPIQVVPTPGGFEPVFALTVHFYDGLAVEQWLDESCLLDNELVTLVPSRVDWDLGSEVWGDLARAARSEALGSATNKAEHYLEALGGAGLNPATIEDGTVSRRVRKTLRGKPTTLGELLTKAPVATATVKIRADFAIYS